MSDFLRIEEGAGPGVDMRRLPSGVYRQVVDAVPVDGASIDAFARIRVSQPVLLLDSKRVGSTPDTVMTTTATGSGSVNYVENRASTALTVGSAVGTAIRQTKARGVYQPGKSLLLMMTFVCAPKQANLNQRVGYFDDRNGVFLDIQGTYCYLTTRSYVSGTATDERILRDNWNLDKMDGTGPSGITLDEGKPQIFIADFEWLGVGRVRCGFVIGGIPVYVHEFLHANAADTSVYMSNPNLPIRWEIEATGTITGTATLEAICGTLASEGGYEILGLTASADTGTAANSIASGATEEIMAIRMQSSFTRFCAFFIQALSVINATSGPFRWRLVLNPTETVAGTWANVPGSVLEQNITRTVTPGTGITIASGYVSASNNQVTLDARPVVVAGTTLAGVTDVFSLQVSNLSVSAEDYYGSMTWREIY